MLLSLFLHSCKIQGSELENIQIRRAYLNSDGDIHYIFGRIPFLSSSPANEKRIRNIIKGIFQRKFSFETTNNIETNTITEWIESDKSVPNYLDKLYLSNVNLRLKPPTKSRSNSNQIRRQNGKKQKRKAEGQ